MASTLTAVPRGLCRYVAAGVLLSCSGSQGPAQIAFPPLPPAATRATLVGPRCEGFERCTCREIGGAETDEAHATAPHKRFEFRIGPSRNELWVTVGDMVLYKSNERPTECFYVDLVPGKHPIQVHGKADGGVGMQVQVAELSAAGPWWYPTFRLDCGGAGWCSLDDMRDEQARIQAVSRGIHAPCGSTRVRGFNWQSGTMPDMVHPEELMVDFVLDVYKFETELPAGSPECGGSRAGDQDSD